MIANGFGRTADYYIIPTGVTSTVMWEVIRDLGIKAVRNTSLMPIMPSVCDAQHNFSADGSVIASGQSSIMIANINLAVAKRACHGIYFHLIIDDSGTPGSTSIREADFRLIIDHVASLKNAGTIICPNFEDNYDLIYGY